MAIAAMPRRKVAGKQRRRWANTVDWMEWLLSDRPLQRREGVSNEWLSIICGEQLKRTMGQDRRAKNAAGGVSNHANERVGERATHDDELDGLIPS
jgi:hypothetical protein